MFVIIYDKHAPGKTGVREKTKTAGRADGFELCQITS